MPTPRVVPSIDRLRQRAGIRAIEEEYGSEATLTALRTAANELRQALRGVSTPPVKTSEEAGLTIERLTISRLATDFAPSLMPTINATGVIVHTNLGRAPLTSAASQRVAEVAAGYANLEYDLATGRRGSRNVHATRLMQQITGAPAAAVVNNNAAAMLLILAALAEDRDVIVSRGELVEIGGGFRIPDIMRQSGAKLREVGTTNKTRTSDYADALSNRTAMILRVHPSNFRIEGFTERPQLADLVQLGQDHNVPVVEDLGSGRLRPGPAWGGIDEPSVLESIRAGVTVCCFSGDKLLGGPQAGIIIGQEAPLAQIGAHPLMRALRVDKMTYAALEATLLEYASGRAFSTVPVLQMLTTKVEAVGRRASAAATQLSGHSLFTADVIDGMSTIGGGGAPGSALPTKLVRLSMLDGSASLLEAKLRSLRPPIVARVGDDCVLVDLRTVLPDQDRDLVDALRLLT